MRTPPQRHHRVRRLTGIGVAWILAVVAGFASQAAFAGPPALPRSAESSSGKKPKPATMPKSKLSPGKAKQRIFTGKVVMLREALKRKSIKSTGEIDKQVVLETDAGELIPIVPDWRGRAFYQDKRLRNRKVELVGYRKPGVPYLQVLMVFTFNDKKERQFMDYWCETCAIPMYEIKPCDCCQQEIELRFQKQDLPAYLMKVRPIKKNRPSAATGPGRDVKKQP